MKESEAHSILNNKFEVNECFESDAKSLTFIRNLVRLSPEDRCSSAIEAVQQVFHLTKVATTQDNEEKTSSILQNCILILAILSFSILLAIAIKFGIHISTSLLLTWKSNSLSSHTFEYLISSLTVVIKAGFCLMFLGFALTFSYNNYK